MLEVALLYPLLGYYHLFGWLYFCLFFTSIVLIVQFLRGELRALAVPIITVMLEVGLFCIGWWAS